MTSVANLKLLLLEMLEMAFQPGDVTATQQLGVQLSSAVKRDGGVTIIQNQNVEVYARIVPSIAKALRLCDELGSIVPAHNLIELAPNPQLPPVAVEAADDPIEECCEFMFEQRIKWTKMQDVMRARYLEYVTGRFKTRSEAARWLDVSPAYLSKICAHSKTQGGSR